MATRREDLDPSESTPSETPRFESIVTSEDASPESVRQTGAGQNSRGYDTMSSSMSLDVRSDDSQPEGSRPVFRQSPSVTSSQFDKQRKPIASRRTSSRRQVPHKGVEFSTDDDVKEVEEDIAMQQAPPSPRIRPSRQQSSTLRRRQSARQNTLSSRDSDDDAGEGSSLPAASLDPEPEQSLHDSDGGSGDDDDDDDEPSDAESFTLKDKQQAINETHPFGIRIWKPALYKKSRSVEKTAEGDIHSFPGGRVSKLVVVSNLLWTLFFGWWLALAAIVSAVACFAFAYPSSGVAYGKVFAGLAWYIIYPFGSFVRLETDENYAEEDEGEGRSISEYERWQNGDLEHGRLFFGPRDSRSLVGRRRNSMDSASEHDSLLGRTRRGRSPEPMPHTKRRLFGRGEWNIGRVVFFLFFYFLIGPLMLLVSLVCWLLVFWIPMARATSLLFDHLRRHPLALSFHSDMAYMRLNAKPSSSILLCTYRAAGLRYWKYTVDGTNIFLINLLAVVIFVIFDYWVLGETLGLQTWLTHPGLIFTLALLSVIPLAYFIGQAVASISAQSSMGLGAAVNAFFSTVVEVYLYCVALTEGKAQLVEGSVIGSIFAGILFLPGLSMCFGAIKRKTQRFNVKSAGVTSTMLLFAVIAAFGPTLFYQVYGSHELNCNSCVGMEDPGSRDCRRCYYSQMPTVDDQFFRKAVQPYSWFAAVLLFLSYITGLWFTLRTHAALIWATEAEEKKAATNAHEQTVEPRHIVPDGPQGTPGQKGSIRDSQMYKRILGQALKHVGLSNAEFEQGEPAAPESTTTPYLVPPRAGGDLPAEDNENLVRQMAEVAATAAAVAARDAGRTRKQPAQPATRQAHRAGNDQVRTAMEEEVGLTVEHAQAGAGHDAPNWSKAKSTTVLLVATILYAVIAEMLVNTVDVVLDNFEIDEKFLGITLFALVPNTTEFLNAISFAMNGNIALSMEIGSAYALQVCLLQIPALVLFSAIYARLTEPVELLKYSFNLIFPQWDMITVILCVFLLSYVYGEGKSNYFKGLILVLTYLVVVVGFYLSGFNNMETMGVDRFDTLALNTQGQSRQFYTVGRTRSGIAVEAR